MLVDLLEVNGLSVDWVSKHIYWTDGRRRSVEVAEFDGTNRRILIAEHLSQPRGIYADPINKFVFSSHVQTPLYNILSNEHVHKTYTLQQIEPVEFEHY